MMIIKKAGFVHNQQQAVHCGKMKHMSMKGRFERGLSHASVSSALSLELISLVKVRSCRFPFLVPLTVRFCPRKLLVTRNVPSFVKILVYYGQRMGKVLCVIGDANFSTIEYRQDDEQRRLPFPKKFRWLPRAGFNTWQQIFTTQE